MRTGRARVIFAYMKTVSLQEATRDLEALADAVERGEVVTVTRDGKPVLDLVPHAAAEVGKVGEAKPKKVVWILKLGRRICGR